LLEECELSRKARTDAGSRALYGRPRRLAHGAPAVGLLIAVGIDSYIRKHQKRIMLIICAPVFRLLIDKKPFNEALFGRDSIVFFVICTVVEVIAYCVRQVKKAGKQ